MQIHTVKHKIKFHTLYIWITVCEMVLKDLYKSLGMHTTKYIKLHKTSELITIFFKPMHH